MQVPPSDSIPESKSPTKHFTKKPWVGMLQLLQQELPHNAVAAE